MKIKYKQDGKVIKEIQTKSRNFLHFETQKNTRVNVFRNKKKYYRKKKHKHAVYYED